MGRQSREALLRLFACDCASRALGRWVLSGRSPGPACWEVLAMVRAVADGSAPPSHLIKARDLADRICKETVAEELELSLRDQMSWYGAINAVCATCHPDYEDAAEYAAREGRRESRRVGDEEREIAWQTERLERLRIIPRVAGD